jgi:RNase P/RNase MRP subunit p30
MTEHDDGKAGGFDVVCVTTVVHNNNSQVKSPVEHFKRLLKEV